MKPLALNLSKMKKIGGDDKHTVFKHDDGHEIKIAHAGISKLQREQLKKLKVEKMADGGEAGSDRSPASADGAFETDTAASPQSTYDFEKPQQNSSQVNTGVPYDTANELPAQQPDQPQQTAQEQPSQQAPDWQASVGEIPKEQNLTHQDQQNQTQPEVEAPPAPSQLERQLNANQSRLDSIYKRHVANDAALDTALANNKIDPNKIIHNMDTGHKILAGLSMIAGGMSAGTLGGENPAVSMMNKAIERDIEAQKNDQSNKMNLWKLHNAALGNEEAATVMARNNILGMQEVKMKQMMGQYPGLMANEIFKNQAQKLALERIQNRQMLSYWEKGTGTNGLSPGSEDEHMQNLSQLRMMNPALAKDIETKTIPQHGVASIPVTPDDRSEIMNYDSLGAQIKNAIDFQKQVGETGAWSIENRNRAEGIKDNLKLSMGKLNDMKRPPSPEIMELYENAVKGIGSVNAGGTMASLNDLQEHTDSRRNTVLKGLGVKPFTSSRQNINQPFHSETKTVNGITYRRGANGEAIRVD